VDHYGDKEWPEGGARPPLQAVNSVGSPALEQDFPEPRRQEMTARMSSAGMTSHSPGWRSTGASSRS
jgi:hypothetical protein